MFESNGDSGPPCGVPSSVALTNPFSKTPAFNHARMSLSTRASVTRWARATHQEVVIHSVEKFLEVEVHDIPVTAREMLLRGRYRLMCRPPRPKAVAVVRKRRVENGLKDLQHRLLDESVESAGHA